MGEITEHHQGIVEALRRHARTQPDRVAIQYVGDGDRVTRTLTYGELDERLASMAVHLRRQAPPGGRALLIYGPGLDGVVALLATFYAGLVAIPATPPESFQLKHLKRLLAIAKDARPDVLLTHSALVAEMAEVRRRTPILESARTLAPEVFRADAAVAALWDAPPTTTDTLAMVQYASGSIEAPRGLRLEHGMLLESERRLAASLGTSDDDVVVNWLPSHADLGLLLGVLHPLMRGITTVLLHQHHVLEQPSRWLRAVSEHRGTISGGPSFVYAAHRSLPDEQVAGLDLARWRVAFVPADPAMVDGMGAFASRFAASGFDGRAAFPNYAIADATTVIGASRADGLALATDAIAAGPSHPTADVLVLGREGHELVGEAGEILVSGPGVPRDYGDNAIANAKAFVSRGGRLWLRSGDVGVLDGDRLRITGRTSDKMLVEGQVFYPRDIERTVESEFEFFRRGRIVAFPIRDASGDGIGVAAEVRDRVLELLDAEAVARAVATAVSEAHGRPLRGFALLPANRLPTTSGGKVHRSVCRALWEDGSFGAPPVGATVRHFARGPLSG